MSCLTFTITIQGNMHPCPKESFVVSCSKARKILEVLAPDIIKQYQTEEKTPVKLDTFFV